MPKGFWQVLPKSGQYPAKTRGPKRLVPDRFWNPESSVTFSFNILRRLLCALIITFTTTATAQTQGERLDERQIQAFSDLGVFYLDTPTTPEALERCIRQKDEPCLSVYRTLKRSVGTIFSDGRAPALQQILLGVAELCANPVQVPDNPTAKAWNACFGAVSCLYFYPSDTEDRAIVDFLIHLPVETLRNIFFKAKAYAGDWVHNRPKLERWHGFIDTLVFLDEDSDGRSGYKALFSANQRPLSGYNLVDPAFIPGPELSGLLERLSDE